MSRFFGILILIFTLFCSCSIKADRTLLNTDNLESWKFFADENTDSVFRTPKGALLKIENGTFSKKVQLEVKEAYTMRDILLGGLSTTSNGMPLSSGGMIYLNAANEEDLQFLKPVSVALPTAYVNTEMQVFEGQQNGDSVNWINPDSLPESSISTVLELGKQSFQQNCATCHDIYRQGTGPALYGFRQRGSWAQNEELRKWVRNPPGYAATNKYTQNLISEYGVIMQAFPALSNEDIDAIAAYLDNSQSDPYDDVDSLFGFEGVCRDTILLSDVETSMEIPILDPAIFSDEPLVDSASSPDFNNVRSPAGAYVFYMATPGWYNIDILTEELPGAVPCDVNVKVMPFDSLLSVYLLLPKLKIQLEGFSNKEGYFTFDKISERPVLQPGTDGLIIAFGETAGQFQFGAMQFSVGRKQTLNLSLQTGKEADFKKLLQNKNLEANDVPLVIDSVSLEAFAAIDRDVTPEKMRINSRLCRERDTTSWIYPH